MRQLPLLSVTLVLVACGGAPAPEPEAPAAPAAPVVEPPPIASAEPETSAAPATPAAPVVVEVTLEARSGSKLAGKAKLESIDGGVRVSLELSGVSPGKHGAHVHETGDCSAPDAKSAGGHFNPGSHDHALPDKAPRHLGDLGNIDIGKDGTGKHSIDIPGANLKDGDPNSFRGRSIIVHEKADDGGQPVGNAGGRVGCGVIPKS